VNRERYYLQVARSNVPAVAGYEGWQTLAVYLDRETAEFEASVHERGVIFNEGKDVSNETVTIARVLSATDLLQREGPQALAAAEASTRIQLQVRLAEQED
jgi:hypothetical protein